eukprot:TRINITY_DN2130_c1_g1_i2.p1 TRINITY_DN2130_c1_g1~~TRINITY_DN2130_c1_g1_i2.p1  ORF type:complete len:118 (-),score=4.98 TRINITY_DN2130_c1_g1_i2:106-459(-)
MKKVWLPLIAPTRLMACRSKFIAELDTRFQIAKAQAVGDRVTIESGSVQSLRKFFFFFFFFLDKFMIFHFEFISSVCRNVKKFSLRLFIESFLSYARNFSKNTPNQVNEYAFQKSCQ